MDFMPASGDGAAVKRDSGARAHRSIHRQTTSPTSAKPELLKPEFSGANFAWLTRDIAESGVMGDPTPATAENGDKWIASAAAAKWPKR
jgi:creatinine amidohydrolase/Fe(II)-dependent formamide hydrolase-like protein